MSTATGDPSTALSRRVAGNRIVDGAVYGLFGLFLALVVVAHTTDTVLAWQLSVAAIVLGVILGARLAVATYRESQHRQAALLSVLGIAFALLGLVYQTSSPGFGFGPNRAFAIVLAFALTVSYVLVVGDARRFTARQWAAVGCFAVLTGLYLAHTLAFVPSSSQSRWPIWAATLMGSGLFVIPRLVPERAFLWLLAQLAALVVLAGLATYAVGEYSLWIFEVGQYPASSPSVPGIDPDVPTLRSIFPNPNGLGLVAFGGFVAAVVEFHRTVVARRPLGATAAGVLAAVCGLGLFLSNARAAMLAAAVAVGIYGTSVAVGRRAVPIAVVGSVLAVAGVLAGMAVGAVDVTASGRFELWAASLRAIVDGPLLFGHGSGPPSVAIEPYLAGDAAPTPHNSYLAVFVQTGLVGGLAYVGLVAGSVATATLDYRRVDVAMLALAVGWAIHQFFESYTLFDWSIGAVLATAAIGYLLFGRRTEPTR
ncbi:O-antigen ligase family protein [Natronococcus sp. JC468]|uniref:O-antigen ligase family protein n=1 Tax=Natronococcus sp. JC468 TaxID=1961921 RepID=UPI0028AEDB9B|nr:O-antigen ligase family protein [Natronococcus sp. JC468]